MFYTPDELLIYAAENNLLPDLVNAAGNNNKGYSYFPVTDFSLEEKSGIRYLRIPGFSGTEDPKNDLIELGGDFFSGLSEMEQKYLTDHPERMTAIIVYHRDEFSILFSINTESPSDDVPSYARELCKDFIEACGINTHGKLKAVCREGDEIARSMFESPLVDIANKI